MKWLAGLICIAVIIDISNGDPLRLRHPDFSAVRQIVHNIADYLERGEYQELVHSDLPKK